MKIVRLFACAGLLALFGQGCLADPPQPNRPILFDFQDAQTQEVLPTPFEPGSIPEAPPAKTGEMTSASGAVVVSSIVPNQELPSPFVIFGRARVFEGVLNWRVKDRKNNTLAEGAVLTDAPDTAEFGNFRARAFLRTLPQDTSGTVEVFTYSARDGSEQDMVRIPIRLSMEDTTLQVFFVNEQTDPNFTQCDNPRAVTRRVPKTQNVAEAALLELLRGPTVAEDVFGSRTGITPGTTLRSIEVEGGVATVDFSRELVTGVAGACQVQAIRSQIEKTLTQFPTVQRTTILVEGTDADPYLQP
jgi:hypothetical protein